jgi:alkylation response protein AidB-like acyl-CoA dehydrogenase
VPPFINMVSIVLMGGTVLAHGTPEQRAEHLAPTLRGERLWCQLFSEPVAGSDLAGLSTRAEPDGDSWRITGQKTWCSNGRIADWGILLARTDPDARKHRGISFFLLDMRLSGIELRPIRQMTGASEFDEVFLDDVVVPASDLVGPENAGWQVAQATLSAERGMTMLELAERLGNGFRWLVDDCARPTARGARPLDDPVVADRLAGFEAELTGLRALCRHLVERVEAGRAGPADASIAKLHYSELLQRMTGFAAEVAGLEGQAVLGKPMSSGWESGAWMLDFIGSWEWTIPGGTSEIQRTIIGERGLGLPREPVVAP